MQENYWEGKTQDGGCLCSKEKQHRAEQEVGFTRTSGEGDFQAGRGLVGFYALILGQAQGLVGFCNLILRIFSLLADLTTVS